MIQEIEPPASIIANSPLRKRPCLQSVQCKAWESCLMAHSMASDEHVKLLGRFCPTSRTSKYVMYQALIGQEFSNKT